MSQVRPLCRAPTPELTPGGLPAQPDGRVGCLPVFWWRPDRSKRPVLRLQPPFPHELDFACAEGNSKDKDQLLHEAFKVLHPAVRNASCALLEDERCVLEPVDFCERGTFCIVYNNEYRCRRDVPSPPNVLPGLLGVTRALVALLLAAVLFGSLVVVVGLMREARQAC